MCVMLYLSIHSPAAALKLGRNSLVSEFFPSHVANFLLSWKLLKHPINTFDIICSGCNHLSQCCNSYEYCVSCCLNPAWVISYMLVSSNCILCYTPSPSVGHHAIEERIKCCWTSLNRQKRKMYGRWRLQSQPLPVKFLYPWNLKWL